MLYKVPAPQSWAFRGAQVACLGVSTIAAQRVGLRNITGIESFQQWRQSGGVKPEPVAQGPAEVDGTLDISGPFRFSRHPLNFWPMPIFWLNPRMTTNLLAFNVAATAYLIVGSAHEEARLRAAYGDKYIEYQNSGIPNYFPCQVGRHVRNVTIDSRFSALNHRCGAS